MLQLRSVNAKSSNGYNVSSVDYSSRCSRSPIVTESRSRFLWTSFQRYSRRSNRRWLHSRRTSVAGYIISLRLSGDTRASRNSRIFQATDSVRLGLFAHKNEYVQLCSIHDILATIRWCDMRERRQTRQSLDLLHSRLVRTL